MTSLLRPRIWATNLTQDHSLPERSGGYFKTYKKKSRYQDIKRRRKSTLQTPYDVKKKLQDTLKSNRDSPTICKVTPYLLLTRESFSGSVV